MFFYGFWFAVRRRFHNSVEAGDFAGGARVRYSTARSAAIPWEFQLSLEGDIPLASLRFSP